MADPKPLYEMTDKELSALHRSYPSGNHPIYGRDFGAEIERRRNGRARCITLATVIFAALSAVGSLGAAIASYVTIYMKLQ